MPKPYSLHSERLLLRQWQASDFSPFADMSADAEVMAYYPSTLSCEQSEAFAHKCQGLIAEKGWGFWALEELASSRFIGFVGLHEPGPELPFSPCVEIGWRLARPFWGQGYATEAARVALDFAFKDLGLNEVVSFTSLSNHRSQAVMERLGMQRELETFMHPALPEDSPLREHCLYRLKSDAWI